MGSSVFSISSLNQIINPRFNSSCKNKWHDGLISKEVYFVMNVKIGVGVGEKRDFNEEGRRLKRVIGG